MTKSKKPVLQRKPGREKKQVSQSQKLKVTKMGLTHLETEGFAIVGVGASAGGLEVFIELFRNLPPDTGMAFVLIQHLSPQHLSMLSTFVQKVTQMIVREAIEGARVEANHVYVIPPNQILEIFHGILHLTPMPVPHVQTMPVNNFLTSLARDQGNLAVGVILSGTGSDGTIGLKDIKSDGGITIVQDPKTSKYNGMPLSAIAAALPDHVLSVEDIAKELVLISTHPLVRSAAPSEESHPSEKTIQILQKIFILIRNATKIDFSTYKYPTIIRRIKRRMVLHRVDTLPHYFTYLQSNPAEVRGLFEDLLINVTDFFRDAEAFDSLKTNVFPKLLNDRAQGTSIRVWVPGCATGEEVYSIAISLLEYLGEEANKYPIQIYGTDICESAIKIARAGIYPETASINLTPIRIDRFFQKDPGGYRVSKSVRDCCIFSIQDVTSQPPINRLDLLSCRNLMIYLGTAVQKKLMETFFYALNPNGYLMLGSSETVGTSASLFGVTDKKNKIYFKKTTLIAQKREFDPQLPLLPKLTPLAPQELMKVTLKPIDPVQEAERIVLERYAPAWVLVNQNSDIVQFKGATGNYIEPASGHPTWNLMRMLRAGLSPDVRVLIHAALKQGGTVRKDGLKVKSVGFERTVDVEATAILSNHCLVIFMERSEVIPYSSAKNESKAKSGKTVSPLENEVSVLREELLLTQRSLQSLIEEQNATNEEMQSANEEVLSANEELQSTNEELETAKEELQSTNEELTSLNDELSSRNRDLDHLNDDLINVLGNVNVSIVMVDPDLKIKRFTPMAEKLLNLIPSDVGRSFMDINIGFKVENFEHQITDVIRNMNTIEIETQDRNKQWYSIRIRPYRTNDNRIDGAVIVFINIDDAKAREKVVHETKSYSEGIIQTVRDPLIVLDQSLRVERANQAFYDIFKFNPQATLGALFYEIGNGQWNSPELRTLLEDVLPRQKEVRNFRITKGIPDEGKKEISLNARALEWEGQIKLLILISLHDLSTEGKQP